MPSQRFDSFYFMTIYKQLIINDLEQIAVTLK